MSTDGVIQQVPKDMSGDLEKANCATFCGQMQDQRYQTIVFNEEAQWAQIIRFSTTDTFLNSRKVTFSGPEKQTMNIESNYAGQFLRIVYPPENDDDVDKPSDETNEATEDHVALYYKLVSHIGSFDD